LILKYEGRHNNSGEKSCSINIGCHDCRMTLSKKFERHRYDQGKSSTYSGQSLNYCAIWRSAHTLSDKIMSEKS